MAKFFGIEIRRATDDLKSVPSFVPRETDDGATAVAAGGAYGTYVDLDGSIRTEASLINKYREMVMNQEVDSAVDDIVNQAIVQTDDRKSITLNLDDTKFSEKIKGIIRNEFEYIQKLLSFNMDAYKIFRRWYIDGRIYYHVVTDPNNLSAGIKELRYIDPRKIRKIREVKSSKTSIQDAMSVIDYEKEYYVFSNKGFQKNASMVGSVAESGNEGVKIAKDSIIYVPSGYLDKTHTVVVSYLHKAIRALNNLRAMEDAVVIYRVSRASEKRIFYIDVGNLPKPKAEQYMSEIMTKFKNRLVYNAETGAIEDSRRIQTLMEDFWLPRREGGRGTEISVLPAGQNLGSVEDILYFQKLLYKALNVPAARLDSSSTFNLGRGAEISRDEDKFSDFITRLRLEFSKIFSEALQRQLILKNILTIEDWDDNVQNIRFRYTDDSYYAEIRENEILNMRAETLQVIDNFVGKYYSRNWVMKNVLHMTEDDINDMNDQIEQERESESTRELKAGLDNLQVQTLISKQAQKDGVMFDPSTGQATPLEITQQPNGDQ